MARWMGGIRRRRRGNVFSTPRGKHSRRPLWLWPPSRSRQTMMSSAMRPPPLSFLFPLHSRRVRHHPTQFFPTTFYPPVLFFIMLSFPHSSFIGALSRPSFGHLTEPFGKSAMSGWPNGIFWEGMPRRFLSFLGLLARCPPPIEASAQSKKGNSLEKWPK